MVIRLASPLESAAVMERGDTTARRKSYGVKLVRGPYVRLEPHPLACDSEEQLDDVVDRLEGPLAADLFCGAGGLSLGLADAGFNVVLGVDHDEDALETHRAYHPGLSVNWDLHDASVVERIAGLIQRHNISLVAGGPPCQPFSRAGRSMMRELVRAGRREAHDRRRDLWESFLGVVELARPRGVLMENVPDMALDRGMVILRTMVERLEALGYSVQERVVDTWRYGVPQFRQRLILVALADGIEFTWPEEEAERVTVDLAIGDLPEVEGGFRPSNGDGADPVASGWIPYGGPRSSFQRKARRGVRAEHATRIYDHITRPVREDDAAAFAQMNPETRYSELDPSLKRYRDDIFDDKYKRLDPHDVSRTITAHIAKDGYWYIHPYEDRTLTIREAARLQTFPDSVRFAGPPSSAFRQIGNAVPPALGEKIGAAIRRAWERKSPARFGTRQIADLLAAWLEENPPIRVPWLGASNRWLVIQSEILLGRLASEHMTRAWVAVRSLTTPEKSLEAFPVLQRLAKSWQRATRAEQLLECAEWMVEHPEALRPDAPAGELTKAPHVSTWIADLACRVAPGELDDPVLAGSGALRVAARFFGNSVNRQNRLSDGRLAIARMIGGDESSHAAQLALMELAAGVCGPGEPACGECPLRAHCAEAQTRPVQETLPLTSRAR